MSTICPKYLEHGFCIHGSTCTLQHIDHPSPLASLQHIDHPSPLPNGAMLKTSFGNLTLEDISSTPSFIPSAHQQAAPQPDNSHPNHIDYYLPTTRLELPSRAFIPAPGHLDKPSADTVTGSELCAELAYEQTIISLYLESKLPDIDKYYALSPLKADHSQVSPSTSYPSMCYRAYSSLDGSVYTLYRFKNCQLSSPDIKKILERWKGIKHPNIVSLHDAFLTKQFGDNSFIVVYEFCAGAQNLKQLYFQTEQSVEEAVLWSYIIQLTAAIRAVHANKLSCRMINPAKIIVTGRNRLRLNCLGVMDLLMGAVALDDASKPFLLQHQQQEDMVELGKVIVCLACNSLSAIHQSNLPKSSDVIQATYSGDVRMLLQHLFNKSSQPKKINELMPMIGARFYTHIEKLRVESDMAQGELRRELENGRCFRLLCKINAVLDRPEHMLDPGWCETGERYILKLFRNFMFHKVDENTGAPWIDLPHLLFCLNKLDSGSPEQIMLTSPHEQSVIIASYKDIKLNFQKCFTEIFGGGI